MWMLQTCLCARLVLACTKKSNLLRCSLFLLLHRELTDFSVMLIYINLSQTRLTCSHQIIYGLSESRCPTLKIIRCILFVGRKSRRKLIVEATQISRFAFGMTVYYSKILYQIMKWLLLSNRGWASWKTCQMLYLEECMEHKKRGEYPCLFAVTIWRKLQRCRVRLPTLERLLNIDPCNIIVPYLNWSSSLSGLIGKFWYYIYIHMHLNQLLSYFWLAASRIWRLLQRMNFFPFNKEKLVLAFNMNWYPFTQY